MAEPTSNKTPERLAIQAAIKADWPEAIKANQEILSTDTAEFGGSNVYNPDRKQAIAEPFGEAPCHIMVSVPPLGGIMVKPV